MPCRSGFLPLRLGCGEGGDMTRYILVTKTKEKDICQVIWGIHPFDLAVRRNMSSHLGYLPL